jgi:ribonuclease Z
MCELGFLGTGGAVSSMGRDNSSFLLNKKGSMILVDCPGNPVLKIRRIGLDPTQLKNVLITHIHPDHVYGLPSLIHGLMLEKMKLRLYGSEETVRFCEDLVDLFMLRERKIACRIEFFAVGPGTSFSLLEDIECTARENPHHDSSLGFHFRIEPDGVDLVYSGDTPIHPPLFHSARDADFFIHDCSAPSRFFEKYPQLGTMHTHARDLGRYAQEAGIKCLIPIHFLGELDYSVSDIEREIRESFTGRLVIPEDFQRMSLSRE